ncbi:unnamed protein product [Diatraea saccharalis]|uniref:CHK kinase-like domain-containing protein n=1 Tax=Diatraea saccharalis TaxID=40085 RepID=A0A9N9QZX3_9NEOP|nr:unnamed protein product [Diatraea saccharalis]
MEDSKNSNPRFLNHYITEEDVKIIVKKCDYSNDDVTIKYYTIENASSKMLGFLADYWRLKVIVSSDTIEENVLCFFIKAVSKTNAAKANMVKELNLFKKETFFYSILKEKMVVPGLKPWSAKFVTSLEEAMVLEDLDALHYKSCNKFLRFDTPHTLRALETLARFHAASIVLENKKSKVLGRPYILQNEFDQFLDKGGYKENDIWFQQCMTGALDAVKSFSKYATEKYIEKIENTWSNIWISALSLSNFSTKYKNVICHRDLWNNNIMFHYKKIGDSLFPDDCVIVDFQAVCCQPLAGDVMVLLYCNLDPTFREESMPMFLNHYYKELKIILETCNIFIDNIITERQFLESAEEQRLWGLIVCACLIPQFWIDDDLTTETFTDADQFKDIMSKDKGAFIKSIMEVNTDYREKVLEIFDEIVIKYCLPQLD